MLPDQKSQFRLLEWKVTSGNGIDNNEIFSNNVIQMKGIASKRRTISVATTRVSTESLFNQGWG